MKKLYVVRFTNKEDEQKPTYLAFDECYRYYATTCLHYAFLCSFPKEAAYALSVAKEQWKKTNSHNQKHSGKVIELQIEEVEYEPTKG